MPPEKKKGRETRPSSDNQPIGSHEADPLLILQQQRFVVGAPQLTGRRVLDSCHASDPWYRQPVSTTGYEAALDHLLQLGLLPAPDAEALRAMHRAGGRQRRAAMLVAEAWELT